MKFEAMQSTCNKFIMYDTLFEWCKLLSLSMLYHKMSRICNHDPVHNPFFRWTYDPHTFVHKINDFINNKIISVWINSGICNFVHSNRGIGLWINPCHATWFYFLFNLKIILLCACALHCAAAASGHCAFLVFTTN